MDRYKKTNLKFDRNLGYGRNLRAAEINSSRLAKRDTRFSMQRFVEEENVVPVVEEKPKSRIATFAKPALKAPMSRQEMLLKWKVEKEMKRHLELQNKKPTFRVGASAPKTAAVFSPFGQTNSRTFNLKNSQNSQKSSLNSTNLTKGVKETGLKPPAVAKFPANNVTYKKTPTIKEGAQPSYGKPPTIVTNSYVKKDSKIQAINTKQPLSTNSNVKKDSKSQAFNTKQPLSSNSSNSISKKDSKIQSFNLKPPSTNLTNPSMKKESTFQVPSKAKLGVPKPSCMPSKPLNNKDFSQVPSTSGIVTNKASNANSKMKPLNTGIKKPEQAQPAGRIPNRVMESKMNKPAPIPNGARQLRAPSKLAAPTKSTGIPNKFGLKPKQEVKAAKKSEDETNITFSCDISHIEPNEEHQQRTSFAPKDFVFDLGPEMSFDYDPLALYKKLKSGEERTSTPKRKEIAEIQKQEAENGKNAENFSETREVSDHQVSGSTSSKTEDSSSETGRVSEDQVVSGTNAKPEDSCLENNEVSKAETEEHPQRNITASFVKTGSNYVEAVTKLVSDISVSAKDSGVQLSCEEKSRIDGSVNNISVTKSSVEDKVDEFNIDPAVFKQDTLENNGNICSTTFDKTTNPSLEERLKNTGTKLNEVNLLEATKELPIVEQSLMPSSEEKENIPGDVFETIPKLDMPETKISTNIAIVDRMTTTIGSQNLPEEKSTKLPFKEDIVEESELSIAGASSSSVSQFKVPVLDGGIAPRRRSVPRVSNMSLRMGRRSEMPQLESISESIECSSPVKSPPKPPKTPKSRKSVISKDFTPRRSLRIARNSVLDATENLFDVRLSLCGDSPDLEGNYSTFDASKMTYDFDNLHLEQAPEPLTPQRRSTRNKKVSLLYTPPQNGRASTVRQSVLKGDLMNFSPDV